MKQLTLGAGIHMMRPVTAPSSTLVDQFQMLAERLGIARLQLRNARLAADEELERALMKPAAVPAVTSVLAYTPEPAVPVQADDDDETDVQSV